MSLTERLQGRNETFEEDVKKKVDSRGNMLRMLLMRD